MGGTCQIVIPGFSGGKRPRKSNVEIGREQQKEEEEGHEKDGAGVPRETDAVGCGSLGKLYRQPKALILLEKILSVNPGSVLCGRIGCQEPFQA